MGKRINQRAIDALKPPERGWTAIWDVEPSGFGVRITRNGARSFVFRYTAPDGRRRLATIARCQDRPLQAAREQARRWRVLVDRGGDPLEERAEERGAFTFGELANRYLEATRHRKRSHPDDVQRVKQFLVPLWGSRRAVAILRRDASKLKQEAKGRAKRGDGFYVANRVLALASAIFSWAEREGLLPEGHANPVRGVPRFDEESRDRFASKEEVAALGAALDSERNPHVRLYFLLLLLTGARKRELLRARWEDIDRERSLLLIPTTKSGRPHPIPLARHAQDVIQALWNTREQASPWLFPGRATGQHLSTGAIDQAWRRVRSAAGCSDLRVHDLRRTMASWAVQRGISSTLVGRTLGHSSPAATAVYTRFEDDSARPVLESHDREVAVAFGRELFASNLGTEHREH